MPDKTNWDALALRWEKLELLEDRVADKKKRLKESILAAVRAHGEITPSAKSMRVLRGVAREIQATFPIDTTIDAKAVREFLRAVPAGLGKRLFDRSEKFSLRPGAWELACLTINGSRAATLFSRAVRRSDGAPRVKVVKLKKAKKAA